MAAGTSSAPRLPPSRTSRRARLFRDVDPGGRARAVLLTAASSGSFAAARYAPVPSRTAKADGLFSTTAKRPLFASPRRMRSETKTRARAIRDTAPSNVLSLCEHVREEKRHRRAGGRRRAARDRLDGHADPLAVEAGDDAEHSREAHGEIGDSSRGSDDRDELLPVEYLAAFEVEVSRKKERAVRSPREKTGAGRREGGRVHEALGDVVEGVQIEDPVIRVPAGRRRGGLVAVREPGDRDEEIRGNRVGEPAEAESEEPEEEGPSEAPGDQDPEERLEVCLLGADPRAREPAERVPEVVGRAGEAPDQDPRGRSEAFLREPRRSEPVDAAGDLGSGVEDGDARRGVGPPRGAGDDESEDRAGRGRAPHRAVSQKRVKRYHWDGYARIVLSIVVTKRSRAATTAASPSSPRAFGTRMASSTTVRYLPSSS